MDVNMLRAFLTLACFVVFLGIVIWAYSGSRRERFEDASRVPLDEDRPTVSGARERQGRA